MKKLTPLADALDHILERAQPMDVVESVRLQEALGRVLAAPVTSDIAVPGEDNSAMDGYALRAKDAGQALAVSQRIAAGAVPEPLTPGTAARIFTGATVPGGADAVAMQEDCVLNEGVITITADVREGQHIRRAGQDIQAGEQLLAPGRRLRPQDLGMLASVGVATVRVYRPLRVAILSTGDELLEPGQPLSPGKLYNSNRYTLQGLLQGLGMEVIDGGIVDDDAAGTREALSRAAASADVVITSGGVSVGEEDHVKDAVRSLGELGLWKLAIKPGKPLAFGHVQGTPFIGLPGNPSSVFVTFCLIARPYLLKRQGCAEVEPPSVRARADFSITRVGTRQEYLRATLSIDGEVMRVSVGENQSSGVLSAVSRSNVLAVIPPGMTVSPGDTVEVFLLDLLSG